MKFYFKYNSDNGECLEECTCDTIITGVGIQPRIGSIFCWTCKYFIRGSKNENWVECKFLTKIDRKDKLKKLNNF